MKINFLFTLVAASLAMPLIARCQVKNAGIEQMPVELEVRFALSALPPAMREAATVYRLDMRKGYLVAQQGKSGVACLIQRTEWEEADFRDDIYTPRCYDAAGARTYLKVLIDAAALRAEGMTPSALKTEMETRFRTKRYRPPTAAGLSYMLAPVMRTTGPDGEVHTMSGPHVMFYAPNLTDKDIGALPAASQAFPFVVREGVDEQSYMVQVVGASERSAIVTESKRLLDELCAYRDVLCLSQRGTP
jgi:hypothetical protein